MPINRKPTRAEIKRFVFDEVRKAAKTQLADSTDQLQVLRNQVAPGLTLAIGDNFTIAGAFIPTDPKLMAALQKLGKSFKPPRPPRKKK
jgi:hypothetical protein